MLEFVNLLNYLALTFKKKSSLQILSIVLPAPQKRWKNCIFRMQQILIKNSIQKSTETILVAMKKRYQIKQIKSIYEMDFVPAEQCIFRVPVRTTWHALSKM